MKRTHAYLILALALLFAFGQAQAQKEKKPKKGKKSQMEKNLADLHASANANGGEGPTGIDIFTEGMKFFILGEYERALGKFMDAAKMDPENAAIQYKIADTYASLQKFDEAQPYAEKALVLDKKNAYYYKLLSSIYKRQQAYDKALKVYEEMTANGLAGEDDYSELAALYLHAGDHKKALQTYSVIEQKYGFSEDLVKQKQRIYLRDNDLENAIAEGQKLVDLYPDDTEYALDQAQLLMRNQRLPQAIAMMERISKDQPSNMQAKLMLSEAYKMNGDAAKAEGVLRETMGNADLDFSAKAEILAGYLQRSYNKESLNVGTSMAEMAVLAHPKEAKAHAMYADFLMSAQTPSNNANARKHYLQSVLLDGDNFNAWQQLISLDWELKQTDSMAKHTEMALEFFPNQATLYFQHGSAKMMLNQYEDAKSAFERAKMLAGTNKSMLAQANSYLGDVYHKLKETDASDAAYEAVLANDPNDAHALNNYSYYLSLRKEKLEKAKEMGAKLVSLYPNSETYLDTYGWVLYVAGDFKEAKKLLEKAANTGTPSATIIEHYGDVLYQLGEHEAALEQWKKAKELGDSENPALLERKLAEKKLIE